MTHTFTPGDRVRRTGRMATVIEFYPAELPAVGATMWVRYDVPLSPARGARDRTVSVSGWYRIGDPIRCVTADCPGEFYPDNPATHSCPECGEWNGTDGTPED